MKEADVKKKVKQEFLQCYLVIEEFDVTSGRIDLLAAKWVDDYRLDVIGIECKGEIRADQLSRLTSDQLARYTRSLPSVYLACSHPGPEMLELFKQLSQLAGTGIITVSEVGGHLQKYKPKYIPAATFDGDEFLRDVRGKIVLQLVFRDLFGHDVRAGPDWVAINKGNDQWQIAGLYRPDFSYLRVNIENAKGKLKDLKAATHHLGKLKEGIVTIWLERWFGQGRRARMPILRKPASQLSETDLDGISQAPGNYPIHVDISVPLWHSTRALSRREHTTLMRSIYWNQLRELFLNLAGNVPDPEPHREH